MDGREFDESNEKLYPTYYYTIPLLFSFDDFTDPFWLEFVAF